LSSTTAPPSHTQSAATIASLRAQLAQEGTRSVEVANENAVLSRSLAELNEKLKQIEQEWMQGRENATTHTHTPTVEDDTPPFSSSSARDSHTHTHTTPTSHQRVSPGCRARVKRSLLAVDAMSDHAELIATELEIIRAQVCVCVNVYV
jgi:hypothetical protein